MLRAAVPVAVGSLVLALAGSGYAAPSADTLIRPGRSIGMAQLGMTEAELRREAGRPLAVVRRNTGFGRATAEYQYADFELFVQLRGRRGALRVVRLSTFQRSERTRERVGVGVLRRTLLARYRGRLRCVIPETATYRRHGRTYVLDERCVLPAPRARTTFFLELDVDPGRYFGKRQPTLEEWVRLARIEQITIETLS
jgi:hypothetical protein